MILLNEVAEKIDEILNQTNVELDYTPLYQYLVATQGFHLDKISDSKTGKNCIPVFISTLGGTNNPVPNLRQSEASIPITFYFPVRFKEDFFDLYDYLCDVFIGKVNNYGARTGDALSNISLANFGEIVDLDLIEFKKWVGSIYRGEIEVMEPYMSMTITLYLTIYDENNYFIGNNIKITGLTISYKGDQIFSDDEPMVIERADIGSSENASQQILGTTHVKGYPANLAFSKQLPLIVKNNESYRNLINICEKEKDIQNLVLTLSEEIPFVFESSDDDTTLEIQHTYYITNYSRKNTLGQLVGISLTLADYMGE